MSKEKVNELLTKAVDRLEEDLTLLKHRVSTARAILDYCEIVPIDVTVYENYIDISYGNNGYHYIGIDIEDLGSFGVNYLSLANAETKSFIYGYVPFNELSVNSLKEAEELIKESLRLLPLANLKNTLFASLEEE